MSPRVQALLKNGWYFGSVRPDEWRADFAEIRKIDQHAESAASSATWTAVGGFVAAALSACMLAEDDPVIREVGIAGLVLGAVLFVLGLVWRARAKAHDFENRRYEVANELVELLSADLAPTAPLTLRLDLRPIDTVKPRTADVKGGWHEKHFIAQFLRLSGKLCDGTGVSLVLTQHDRQRSKWKRSASGKSKYKSKNATWLAATVKLKMAGEQAEAVATAPTGKAMQLPRGAHFAGMRVTKKGLMAQAWSEQPWTAPALGAAQLSARDLAAMLLVSLFQLMGQEKAGARRTA